MVQQEGRYEYKYIIDGEWTLNQDEPISAPNKDGHVNNYIQVKFNSLYFVQVTADMIIFL